jgi:hypothetical protein
MTADRHGVQQVEFRRARRMRVQAGSFPISSPSSRPRAAAAFIASMMACFTPAFSMLVMAA